MKVIVADKWIPCDGIILEENAEASVKTKKNVLVVAGPGAGKTELLAQKASYLFQTNQCREPRKILAISFKKDAAENLKKRVISRCGKEIEDRFISMTYDAFFKNILDHFLLALPEDIRPLPNYLVEDAGIIERAFARAGFINTKNLSRNKLKEYYDKELASVQLPFSGQGLGESVWKLLLKGFDGCAPALSFKMISILAEYIIKTNPKIKKGLQLTYQYVFLDEFQDTTDLQYDLVKQCFLSSNSILTAVGDNKQRIMLWAGARKTVFRDFEGDFAAETKRLLMNHRSAPRLVDLQKKMYDCLLEEKQDIRTSSKWNPDDGEISLLIADNEDDEAIEVAESIMKKVAGGIAPNKLCILCKQTPFKYVEKIISELDKRRIYARIETEYQDLIKEPIVEILCAFLRLSIDIKRPKDWGMLVDLLSKLWDADSYDQYKAYYEVQDKLNKEIKFLFRNMQAVHEKTVDEIVEHIVGFLGVKQLKAMFPNYSQGDYLNEQLTKYTILFKKELEKAENDWLLAIENFEGMHSIPIMTIHKSKGLEYNCVYFVGLEDSAFWNFKAQPEEDRCAFFVALSRAKQEIMFTFSKYRNTQRCPWQSHDEINEFFELLQEPGLANIIIKEVPKTSFII